MEVVASLSQGRTAAAQCGLFTHKSVPVIFEPPCTLSEWEDTSATRFCWGEKDLKTVHKRFKITHSRLNKPHVFSPNTRQIYFNSIGYR